jgi:RNA 2',3'-cyclic 3'-phosphodiesterase
MESLRTFVGINVKVDQILLRKWQEIKSLLRNDSIKWVDEQTLHLTLFFLGETPSDKIETIAKTIELEIKNIPSFKIVLQGFGVFGNPKNPKVIWAGIAKSEQLFQLKKIVSSTIIPFGFDEPDGKFSPHFTLGRIKQQKSTIDLINYINLNKTEVLQEVVVDKVIFYQSILKPSGPVYIPIKEIKLLSL